MKISYSDGSYTVTPDTSDELFHFSWLMAKLFGYAVEKENNLKNMFDKELDSNTPVQ